MNPSSDPKTVVEAYGQMVASGSIEHDRAQAVLARRLDVLLDRLSAKKLGTKSSSLGWLLGRKRGNDQTPEGIYIHGKVGRGKSMLMDMFFGLAKTQKKRRAHFNDFMADVHERIGAQREAFKEGKSRESDPIGPVGKSIADEAHLLCFDEFTVTDIADAMILGRLSEVLFDAGTVLVATSNVHPDDLYRDGLNRPLFLPFVAKLKAHCEVFELDARTDFRLEKLTRGQAYLSPLGKKASDNMEKAWEMVTQDSEEADPKFKVKGRTFEAIRAKNGACWFGFDQLCREPRAASDFLTITSRFDTVFIEGVPMMDNSVRNEAKRFILLIDTLYDRSTRTIISAAANPHALFTGSGTEAFEFQRTASRLIEMQSQSYLEQFEQRQQAGGAGGGERRAS